MKVVHKATNQILGTLSSLEKIADVGTKFMLEPFVHKHNFIVYEDFEGQFGVACPKTHILREVVEQ